MTSRMSYKESGEDGFIILDATAAPVTSPANQRFRSVVAMRDAVIDIADARNSDPVTDLPLDQNVGIIGDLGQITVDSGIVIAYKRV